MFNSFDPSNSVYRSYAEVDFVPTVVLKRCCKHQGSDSSPVLLDGRMELFFFFFRLVFNLVCS